MCTNIAKVLNTAIFQCISIILSNTTAVVYWSNRLDFVAEMDVISNGFNRFQTRRQEGENEPSKLEEDDVFLRELWKKFMYLFDDDIDDHGIASCEFLIYGMLRIGTACFVIPLWLVLGLFTCGLLWPPQIREKLLTGHLTSRTTPNISEDRLRQISELRDEISMFHTEMVMDMARGREDISEVKFHLDGAKLQIHTEMNNVKEIVTELFECLST